MPIYEFETPSGGTIEQFCPSPDSGGPKIGDRWLIDGRWCTRIASSMQVSAAVATNCRTGYPYTSLAMPRWSEGCKHTKEGKPIITSQRHEREMMARHNRERD